MFTYKENGVYVLQADSGKMLYNATLDVYVEKVKNGAGVKLTDWIETDPPTAEKTDAEIRSMFTTEILESIPVIRETKPSIGSGQTITESYSFDAEHMCINVSYGVSGSVKLTG